MKLTVPLKDLQKAEKRIAELEQERKDAEARFQAALQYSGEVNTKNQQLRDALNQMVDILEATASHTSMVDRGSPFSPRVEKLLSIADKAREGSSE